MHIIYNAACRGKLTEQYGYRLIQGFPVTIRAKHTGSLQADVSERVQAIYRWMQKYNPQYVDSQSFVWNAQDRVCWQRDLRVRIAGRLWLIDIKCTSKPEKDWPLQLGCGLSYDEDGCDHAAILHVNPRLNRDGFRFINKWKGSQLKDWYRRAVDRWKSERDFNLLKGELGFESEAMGLETEEELA